MGWRRWCWRGWRRRRGAGSPPLLLHVARDDRRLEALAEGLAFFAPQVRVIQFPAWDTVPYDRIGPNAEIVATRVAALARLAAAARKGPTVVLTTVNAILQRVPPREFIRRSLKTIAPGQRIDMNRADPAAEPRRLPAHRHRHGARRVCRARRHPRPLSAGPLSPVRLDFFGDTLEHIKAFDPETQRTGKIVQKLTLMPISEVAFGETAEKRFRRGYVETFGPVNDRGPALRGVSAGPALSRHGALAAAVPRASGDAVRLRAGRARQLRPPGRARRWASGWP